MDCEDSVAAVDAEDKAAAYRNWLGRRNGDQPETCDKRGQRWYLELASGKSTLVDKDGSQRAARQAWSADSRWLTYTKNPPNNLSAVLVYTAETVQATQGTDGMSDPRDASGYSASALVTMRFAERRSSPCSPSTRSPRGFGVACGSRVATRPVAS